MAKRKKVKYKPPPPEQTNFFEDLGLGPKMRLGKGDFCKIHKRTPLVRGKCEKCLAEAAGEKPRRRRRRTTKFELGRKAAKMALVEKKPKTPRSANFDCPDCFVKPFPHPKGFQCPKCGAIFP